MSGSTGRPQRRHPGQSRLDRWLARWVKGGYPHNTIGASMIAAAVILLLTLRDWWRGGQRNRSR